jgi:hypothetical protein
MEADYSGMNCTSADVQAARAALRVEALPLSGKEYFLERLESLDDVRDAR